MDQPTPDWLNEKYFTQCLQHEKNNKDIVVTNLTNSPAAPAGNNYGSYIIRVKVEYKNHKNDAESHSISLIVKSELTGGPMKEILEGIAIEMKEPLFYKTFLPEVSKITKTDFAPKTLFSPVSNATILEDLKEQGFLMADRIKQLDFDHCCLYMEAAASFHAASFAIHEKSPELIESLGKEMDLSALESTFKNMIKSAFTCLAGKVNKIERFKKYCKLFEDFSENLWPMVRQAQKPSKTINTLTQGDPWTTNMMFKYDSSGKVREVKLLDFQGLTYACPANDIVFFVWSSAQQEVRRNRLDDLYKVYLKAFNQKLEELKCTKKLTFDDLKDHINKLSPFAIYMVGTMSPLFLDPSPVDFKSLLTNTSADENPYEKYYNETFCLNVLPNLMEELELAGVFDYFEKCKKPG